MTKAKVFLILAFIAVCAAGAVVGTAVDRHVRPVVPFRDPISFRLNLNPEQQQKMRAIWDDFGKQRDAMFQKRRQYDQQREDQIRSLLTASQLVQYDQLQHSHEQQVHALDDQMRQAAHAADAASRALLTPDQQKEWDQMRQKAPHHMGSGGMGGPGRMRHDHHHPSTRPSSQPGPGDEQAGFGPPPGPPPAD